MKKNWKIIIGIFATLGILSIAVFAYLFYIILYVDYKYTGQELFDEVNKYREYKNLSKLELDPVLCDNIVERYLAVKNPNSGHKGFKEWLKEEGIMASDDDNSKYNLVGELYVNGVSTPSNAINWWLGSPGHKSTLELPSFNKGCAYANDGTGVVIMAEPANDNVKEQ